MVRSARSRVLSVAAVMMVVALVTFVYWQSGFSRVSADGGAEPAALDGASTPRLGFVPLAKGGETKGGQPAEGGAAGLDMVAVAKDGARAPAPRLRFIPKSSGGETKGGVTAGEEVKGTEAVTTEAAPAAEEVAAPSEAAPAEAGTTTEPAAEATTDAATEATAPAEPVAPTEEVTSTEELTETAESAPVELVDLVDTATAAGNFTTLLAALEAAGLVDILRSEGPYTVFAPTDEAFAALPEGRLDELMADPAGSLLEILLYHVLPGKVMSAELTDGATLETIQGDEVTVTVADDGVQVNAANVTTPDVEATNGVIHVIDGVLSAPVGEGEEVAPGEELTATQELTGTSEMTATEPLTGTEPLTPSEEITSAVSMNATDTAAEQAAVVVTAPARLRLAPLAAPAAAWETPQAELELFSPADGGAYHSPLDVAGLSQTFTGNVRVSLVGDDGTVLAERVTVGGEPAASAFFYTTLRFSVQEPTAARLQIVDMDMAEGTVMAESGVAVTLLPGQRMLDVTFPQVGETVCGSLVVSGYSNTFEANVVVELLARAEGGRMLEQVPATGGTLGVYRDFVAPLATVVEDGPQAMLLAVYASDASGRFAHIDRTVVPFTLYPAGSDACLAAGE